MPVYQYGCPDCGLFELVRPMETRNDPLACPACRGALSRVIASAPRLGSSDRGRIDAHARNERARDDPARASRQDPGRPGASHPPGCGCCGKTSSATTRVAADGAKSFPTRRPWMIAH